MAVIDKLNAIGDRVHGRHSYSKYLIAVLHAHGLTMGDATQLMGRGRSYLSIAIAKDELTQIGIVMYNVALTINVPPRELLKPLNTGLNADLPYTYGDWKKRLIANIHDRFSMINCLTVLARLRGTTLASLRRLYFRSKDFRSSLQSARKRSTLKQILDKLSKLLDLSQADVKNMLNKGYTPLPAIVDNYTPQRQFSIEEIACHKRTMNYERAVLSLKNLTIKGLSRKHHVQINFINNHLNSTNPKSNKIVEQKFPEFSHISAVGNGDERPFDNLLTEYSKTINTRKRFAKYFMAVIYRYGKSSHGVNRQLGHGNGYCHSILNYCGYRAIDQLCHRVAKIIGVKPSIYTRALAKLKRKLPYKSHRHYRHRTTYHGTPIRNIGGSKRSLRINIPHKFGMKLGTPMAVTKRNDGSIVFTPLDIYKKRHPSRF